VEPGNFVRGVTRSGHVVALLRVLALAEREANAGQLLGDVPEVPGNVPVLRGGGAPDELRCAALLPESSRPYVGVAGNVGDSRVKGR